MSLKNPEGKDVIMAAVRSFSAQKSSMWKARRRKCDVIMHVGQQSLPVNLQAPVHDCDRCTECHVCCWDRHFGDWFDNLQAIDYCRRLFEFCRMIEQVGS